MSVPTLSKEELQDITRKSLEQKKEMDDKMDLFFPNHKQEQRQARIDKFAKAALAGNNYLDFVKANSGNFSLGDYASRMYAIAEKMEEERAKRMK